MPCCKISSECLIPAGVGVAAAAVAGFLAKESKCSWGVMAFSGIAAFAACKVGMKAMKPSLYTQLGGEAAVDAAVDKFYDRVLADKRVNHWFAKTNMVKQRKHQKQFLTMVFGGPNNYSGADLKQAHAHLKLTEDDFFAIADNLAQTLLSMGVPQNLVDEVIALAATTKDDCLWGGLPLFERIGGAAAVDAAVDAFYVKVLADDRVKDFFKNTDMKKQAQHQKRFMTYAFGGSKAWSGRSMRAAHAGMGLKDVHFNTIAELLVKTLTEMGVSKFIIDEVVAVVETTRADVLQK